MKKRFEAWAGIGWPKWMKEDFGLGEGGGVIWPIVDNETCGVINGSPTPEQWFAIGMSPEASDMIADAMNHVYIGDGENTPLGVRVDMYRKLFMEQVEKNNELYRELEKRGLLDEYGNWIDDRDDDEAELDTPWRGTEIEWTNEKNGTFSIAHSTGYRHENKLMVYISEEIWQVKYWRYPGEEDWRD